MKIVIVEDEIRIREGIEKLLNRISVEHEIVGCAEDGEEGIRVIEERKPDLVITDVRMPKMDGIQMLIKLKEQMELPKVIIISAYSEFEYARQALKLGVSEYILKPVSVVEFTDSFETIANQLKLEKEQEQTYQKRESFETIIKQELYYGATLNPQINKTLLGKYQFDVSREFCVLLVHLGKEFEAIRRSIGRDLQHLFDDYEDVQTQKIELETEKKLVFFLYNYQSEKKLERWLQNRVAMYYTKGIGEDLCFGWTEILDINELKNVFNLLCKSLDWNITLGSGVIVSYPKVEAIQTIPVSYPINIEQEMRESLCSMNVKKIDEQKKSFIRYFHNGSIYLPQEIKASFVRFVWSILNVMKEINIICYEKIEQEVILGNIMTSITSKEIEKTIDEIIEIVIEHGFEENHVDSLTIQRMKSMVHEFYNQGITLDVIAEKLQMTPEYLGTQFHKEVGVTYSTYLKKYRIEKAKKLLLGTDLKTYEIAKQIGYNDPKYFSKVFKEMEGVLPGDYRKKH